MWRALATNPFAAGLLEVTIVKVEIEIFERSKMVKWMKKE
jgi:hypothetical protein